MSMIKKINQSSAIALALIGLAACSGTNNRFTAEGTILGAEGEMLYLEEVGTGNVMSLDSVRLDGEGAFRFSHDGTHYPMFYRVRLGKQSIPFAADSATHIVIKSSTPNLLASYELVDADTYNHQIREVIQLRQSADRRIDSILGIYNSGTIALDEAREQVDLIASELKTTLSNRFIFTEPKSPVAYFALFQRKGDSEAFYFSADEDTDERAFAAVATAYDLYYAEAPYTPFLKDMALRAIARGRAKRAWERSAQEKAEGASVLDFPEIALPDNKGQMQSLTAIAKERPVLISFTAYSAQWSPMLVASLQKLQEKRPDITIYEVSLDGDSYYWQNASRTLPWISVNDPEGRSAMSYNVGTLPSFFLIDKGEIKRIDSLEGLSK